MVRLKPHGARENEKKKIVDSGFGIFLCFDFKFKYGVVVKIGIIRFMPFEYDPHKSDLNRTKHGINFDEAQSLWDDEAFLEIPARNLDEPRFVVIGKIKGKHWSAVINYRDGNIRIISVRRSRDEEIELDENESL